MADRKRASDTESGEEKESLYYNEDDRRTLMFLTEVEREKILDERREYNILMNETRKINQLSGGRTIQPAKSPEYSDEDQPSKRKKRKSKLDEEYEPRKKKPQVIDKALKYDHKKETAEVRLDDIEKIRVSRTQLAKWSQHIFFEKTTKGAFVRVTIGKKRDTQTNIYLMCEIVDITKEENFYELRERKIRTNLQLVLAHGKTKKTMRMDIVSNSPFTEEEFLNYMTRLKKDGLRIVTHHHIETKELDLQQTLDYKYTSAERDEMLLRRLEEGLKQGKVDLSAVLELERLKAQLEDLKMSVEELEPDVYWKKRTHLEELIRKVENSTLLNDRIMDDAVVERLNERNRNRQLEIDSRRRLMREEESEELEIDEGPSTLYIELNAYEQGRVAIQQMLQLHCCELEIDGAVEDIDAWDLTVEYPRLVTQYPGVNVVLPSHTPVSYR